MSWLFGQKRSVSNITQEDVNKIQFLNDITGSSQETFNIPESWFAIFLSLFIFTFIIYNVCDD